MENSQKRTKILAYIKNTVMGETPDEQYDFAVDYHIDSDVWENINDGKKKFTIDVVSVKDDGIDFDINEEYRFTMVIDGVHMSRDEMIQMTTELRL